MREFNDAVHVLKDPEDTDVVLSQTGTTTGGANFRTTWLNLERLYTDSVRHGISPIIYR